MVNVEGSPHSKLEKEIIHYLVKKQNRGVSATTTNSQLVSNNYRYRNGCIDPEPSAPTQNETSHT
jgi:hypothetical protein